jgi:hypothetical protein
MIESDGRNMKQLYNAFRFILACAIIFGCGYLVARPRVDADKIFAPLLCALAVYYLWRGREHARPSPSHNSFR